MSRDGDVPEQRHRGPGLPRAPRVGIGSRGRRAPGVVGHQRPDQRGVRPLRGGRVRRARARHLPRCRHERTRRSRQADDVAQHRAGGEGHVGRGRLPRRARRRHVGGRRCHRVLHGWRARAVAGDVAARPGRGGRAVLRRGRMAEPARLRADFRRRSRATTPRTTTSPARRRCRRWRRSSPRSGKEHEFFVYPGTEHAFTNHHRPEVYDEEHSETAWAPHARVLSATTCADAQGLQARPIAFSIDGGHRVVAAGEQRGALDVDGVAVAIDPRVPRTGRDRGEVAVRGDARRGDRPAARAPRLRRRSGPWPGTITSASSTTASSTSAHIAGIALERERRHAEEAQVAGEAHVDVGDEHDEVAGGVTRRGKHLDARRELRGTRRRGG